MARQRRVNRVLIAVLVFLVVLTAFGIYFVFGEAVPRKQFEQVSVGMTQAEVQALIGVPHVIRHDTPTTTAYFYGGLRRAIWCTMEVYFDAAGRVTGKFHDH